MAQPFPTRRPKLAVEVLEDRTTPTFISRPGAGTLNAAATDINVNGVDVSSGGLSIAIGHVITSSTPGVNEYVLGTGPGIEGTVRVYDQAGNLLSQFVPFAGYTGGLNVAVGDLYGNGQQEIVVTPAGVAPPVVAVFSGTGTLLSEFMAFAGSGYTGGLNVAVGDVLSPSGGSVGANAPGQAGATEQIIIGAATMAPAVAVYTPDGTQQQFFYAFPANAGTGVTVAAAALDDPTPADPTAPDLNAYAEIIVGAASVAPLVGVYSLYSGSVTTLREFFAFDPTVSANQTGVTVAAGDTDGTGIGQIYVAPTNGSTIATFRGDSYTMTNAFTAYPTGYSRVVNMAVGNLHATFNQAFGFPGLLAGQPADLAVVSGDGPYFQQPLVYPGLLGSPAGTITP